MEIETIRERDAMVVSVIGRMDAVASLEFYERMSELISAGEKRFLVNLSKMDYISSTGLRSILKMAKQLTAKDGNMIFVGLQGQVQEVFKISAFSTIFQIFETEEDARKLWLCES